MVGKMWSVAVNYGKLFDQTVLRFDVSYIPNTGEFHATADFSKGVLDYITIKTSKGKLIIIEG